MAPAYPATLYLPPTGRYLYASSGFVRTTKTGGGTQERQLPATSPAEVTSDSTTLPTTLTMKFDHGFLQESVEIQLSSSQALITRIDQLIQSPSSNDSTHLDLSPGMLAVRAPTHDGDDWPVKWADSQQGVRGSGQGHVDGIESVTTPAGTFHAMVVTVDQTLSGTATGYINFQIWFDVSTGVEVKRVEDADVHSPLEAIRSHVEIALMSRP